MATNYSDSLASFIREATGAQMRLIRGEAWRTSTIPYVRETEDGSGSSWEFDYRWLTESGDMPTVQVTALRLVTNSGAEYPVKLRDVCGRWLAECESLIADEVAEDSDATAQTLAEPPVCPDCGGRGGETDTGVQYCNCEVQP